MDERPDTSTDTVRFQSIGDEPENIYEAVFREIEDAVFLIDIERTNDDYTFIFCRNNASHQQLTGFSKEELRGQTPRELLGDDQGRDVAANYRRCVERKETIEYQETLDLPSGTSHWQTKLTPITDDGQVTQIVGIARDVTQRVKRETALRRLYEAAADTDHSFEEKIRRILEVGREYLDLPYGFFTVIDEKTQRVKHAVGDHELLQPGASAPLEEAYCRKTIQSEDLVSMEDARAELGSDDPAYERFGLNCYVGTKVLVGGDLYGTFCFAAPSARNRSFTDDEREIVKLLGQWTGYELERQQFEDRLRGLHQVSQQLLLADTADEAARIAVETGRDLFDLPMTACWEYDPGEELLRPLARTEECLQVIGETPTFERGEALIWEAFDSNEVRVYEEIRDRREIYNTETPLHSEIHVPLGDHGVIISGATEPRAFDEIDIKSLRLLGTLVREALTAVEREQALAERGEALQRQNERLEEFVGVLVHDLRNPLAGAIGALEVARETNEERFFARTEQSLERMDDLIQELLEIARGERQAVNARDLSLDTIVEEAWSYIDAPKATLSTSGDLGRIHADETRLLQLFANLFRNSVEHASDDVTVEVGHLAENEGFYVADDGPGLPTDVREAFRDFGLGGSPADPGIGLASVVDIVDAHGWNLSLPDADDGARFEIRTDSVDDENHRPATTDR